jgi:nitrite reductase (NADH) small subunit
VPIRPVGAYAQSLDRKSYAVIPYDTILVGRSPVAREIRVCAEGEIPDGEVRLVREGNLEIGVIRKGEEYFAYRNVCPHQGGPVCEGLKLPGVIDVVDEKGLFHGQSFDENDIHIVCPWHGYEFHLRNGENVCDKRLRLQKFEVSASNGEIYVTV